MFFYSLFELYRKQNLIYLFILIILRMDHKKHINATVCGHKILAWVCVCWLSGGRVDAFRDVVFKFRLNCFKKIGLDL